MEPDNSLNRIWPSCNEMEKVADKIISKLFSPYELAFKYLYEAGVQAPTLPSKRIKEKDIIIASLFLKRSLNDFRSIWILIKYGYTAQAASVAATLFENALSVICISGNLINVERLLKSKGGDLPWKILQMVKILSEKIVDYYKEKNISMRDKEYELLWREIYSAYKWLCKIKHPTLKSATHEIGSTFFEGEGYVIMAAPNVSEEDISVKSTILTISFTRLLEAIESYVNSCETDINSNTYKDYRERIDKAKEIIKKAYIKSDKKPLPFDIRDSSLVYDYRRIRLKSNNSATK